MFSNILVGVDGRPGGRDAIAFANQLVAPGGRITLTNVYGNAWTLGRGGALLLSAERAESEQLLARARAESSVEGDELSCPAGRVGRTLHELAERRHVDLLVIGSCHRGPVGRVLMGNDTLTSLNGAPCAVAIAPYGYGRTTHELVRIGVGYDASAESKLALAAARELAARHGSTISALSVVSLQSIPYGQPIPDDWPEVAQQLVDEDLARLHELGDVDGDASYGEPSEELTRFSEGLDLMIVGSRGHGPLGRLFNGSTSNHLAHHAYCPLLVLPRAAATGEHDTPANGDRRPVGAQSPGTDG